MDNPEDITKAFDYPVPGQGLTQKPGNGAWEKPPELVDLNEVADWFWERLTTPDIFRDTMRILDAGVPIDFVAANLVAQATMSGKFNVDIALSITPIVVVQMTTLANMAGAKVSMSNQEKPGVDPTPLAKMFNKATKQEDVVPVPKPETKPKMPMGLLSKIEEQ